MTGDSDPAPGRARGAQILLGLCLCGVGGLLLRLAWLRPFSLDEFDYANAAWLVSQGLVPYRDFFDSHFPLVYQSLSLVFLVVPDEPTSIRLLRLAMLPVGLTAGWSVWALNRRWAGDMAALVGAVSLFGVGTFSAFMTEVRPDSLALAFLVASLAVVERGRLRPRVRGLLAGVLLGLSIWSSQKVLVYGAPIAVVFVADLVALVRRRGEQTLGSAPAFAAGLALVAVVVVGMLSATRSLALCYYYCFEWNAVAQSSGALFSWGDYLFPILNLHGWLFALAVVGVGATVIKAFVKPERRWFEVTLVLLLASTLAMYLPQAAPYPYSLLPFLAFVGLFAGRGVAVAGRFVAGRGNPSLVRWARIGAAVLLSGWAVLALRDVERLIGETNAYQLEVLEEISELTTSDDRVYANSGSFVTRHPVHFYYYTNAPIRIRQAEWLADEMPSEILDGRAVAFLLDLRFRTLPEELRRFVFDHYAPYNSDLWLWGMAMGSPAEPSWNDRFHAVVDGTYFLHPAQARDRGELSIDGERIGSEPFHLTQGAHDVKYDGPPGDLAILWLPRNGELYEPSLTGPTRFSIQFGGM